MKLHNLVKHINHETNRGEVLAIDGNRAYVAWDTHTGWNDLDELVVLLDGEEGLELLQEMFNHYEVEEYKPAFEAVKADYERICKENREMRNQLHKGVRKSA